MSLFYHCPMSFYHEQIVINRWTGALGVVNMPGAAADKVYVEYRETEPVWENPSDLLPNTRENMERVQRERREAGLV
jgi:hypothetical protein